MIGFKPYTIGFITDPTLSRDRMQIALRAVSHLREIADVRFFAGNLSEEELLGRIQNAHIDLLLAPWHKYLHYSRIEAFFGTSRLGGATMIGYFTEDIAPHELSEEEYHLRSILIDLNRLSSTEAGEILKLFLRDSTRSGIKSFLNPRTLVHYETWSAQVGLGFRIDTVLNLPEIKNAKWKNRTQSIRLLLSSLWSLVFDSGPGRRDLEKSQKERENRAYFECAADSGALIFRLCYAEPGWKSKDVLHQFWPGSMTPSHAGQILGQFSDLLRVHVDPESSELEITLVLYPSAPAERTSNILKSIWIEPLSKISHLERSLEHESTNESYHRPLVTHHHLIGNAVQQIEDLRQVIESRDETIRNLSSKGKMTETVFVYPNGLENDQLIHLISKKITESRSRMLALQHEYGNGEVQNSNDIYKADRIMRDIRELVTQQRNWITKLKSILLNAEEDLEPVFKRDGIQKNAPKNTLLSDPVSEEEEALSVAGTEQRTDRRPKKRNPYSTTLESSKEVPPKSSKKAS